MKCEICGKVLNKNHKYCPNCGAKVVEEEVLEEVENEIDSTKSTNEIDLSKSTEEKKEEVQPIAKEQVVQSKSPKKNVGLGIAGFVLSLVGIVSRGFVTSLLGLIFSAVAKSKFNPEKNKGYGLIVAGFVIGIIAIVVASIKLLVDFYTNLQLISVI